MKCFRWRCYVNNSFLVFHQGTKHSKTIKHSRFALVFHTVFSCLDPLMKHSNSLFTYNIKVPVIEIDNDFNHKNFDRVSETFKVQKISLFRQVVRWSNVHSSNVKRQTSNVRCSAKCPFGKTSVGKMSVRQNVFRQSVFRQNVRVHRVLRYFVQKCAILMARRFSAAR